MVLKLLQLVTGLVIVMAGLMLACAGAPAAPPSATPPPTSLTSSDSLPVTSTAQLEDLTDIALAHLTELASGLGPRESATDEEGEAAEYLASRLSEMGYPVQVQPFPVKKLSLKDSGLTVYQDSGEAEKIPVNPLSGSGFGQVSGSLVSVGLGRPEEIPEGGLKGEIALVKRGIITFERKARNVRAAGAIGLVVHNNKPGDFKGDLAYSADFPAVSISRSDGQRLEELIASGGLDATLSLMTEEVQSRNVIAESPGTGENVVIIGAHYDTVPDVPGASDNASGTAVVLTMAQALSGRSLPFTVRFIAFGSEELGLLGSRAYVDSLAEDERGRILAMLNFDALGGGTSLTVMGNLDLMDLASEQGRVQDVPLEVSPGIQGGSSDHEPFARAGVPVVMFSSDDVSRIHTSQDTLEFINPDLPGAAARLGLGVLDALAESP